MFSSRHSGTKPPDSWPAITAYWISQWQNILRAFGCRPLEGILRYVRSNKLDWRSLISHPWVVCGTKGKLAIVIGITVAHSLDGLAIAWERIAKEAEENTGFLDLGMLGLAEFPDELFRPKHLRGLNLGSGYFDPLREWEPGVAGIKKNAVGNDLGRLGKLTELQSLSLCDTVLSDLSGLSGIASLVQIDCAATQVNDLAPIAGLSRLQTLDCSGCRLAPFLPPFWCNIPKMRLLLYQATIPSVPAEVLSRGRYDDCFDSLRAHLETLQPGGAPVL